MPCHLYVRQMSQSCAFCLRISWNYRKTRRAVRFCRGKEVENSHISQNHAMQIEIIWSRNTTPNKLPKLRATTLNIVGCCVRLHTLLFVVCCCVLLGVVAKSLKPVKRLGTTTPNIVGPTMLRLIVASVWT